LSHDLNLNYTPIVYSEDSLPNFKEDPSQKGPLAGQGARTLFIWLSLVIGLIFVNQLFDGGMIGVKELKYSEFKLFLENNQIEKVSIGPERIQGQLKGIEQQLFRTTIPPVKDDSLIPLLEKHRVSYAGESSAPPLLLAAFLNLLPWMLIFGFFWYSSRRLNKSLGQMPGGNPFFGKQDAGIEVEESDKTFDDVAGVQNAKRDLQEIVDFLKHPDKYTKLGALLPKGVLMMGPPGTGKTLLAKATAGEAGVPFISISGSEFIELFVGMGASRVRRLFEKAKEKAPSIIFIDEIDSIGRSRGTGLGGGHDEREQTLNQILSEMDGFMSDKPVVVLAATNRPDILDPALIRPGRFDRQVVLDLPMVESRKKILAIHSRNVPLDDDVNIDHLAQTTAGFSGADLRNLVNEASLFCARRNGDKVNRQDFSEARDKVLMGNPREESLIEKQKEVVATHEAGHALVALLTPGADTVKKVTIVPRGRALGFTEQVPSEDQLNVTETYLKARLDILLGGRMAEELIYNERTTGAENDLKEATKLARRMVINWGMSSELGPVAYELGEDHPFLGKEIGQPKNFSEKTAQVIDKEIHDMLIDARTRVKSLLEQNKNLLLLISAHLIEKETLEEEELKALMSDQA
jgi:cell division protease FtsH